MPLAAGPGRTVPRSSATPGYRALAAADRTRLDIGTALAVFAGGTRRCIVVSTVFGLIVALIDVGGLYWLAVPLPLLWGLLSLITDYSPTSASRHR